MNQQLHLSLYKHKLFLLSQNILRNKTVNAVTFSLPVTCTRKRLVITGQSLFAIQRKSELHSITQFAIQKLLFIFWALNFQGHLPVINHYHCEKWRCNLL